MPQIVKPQTKLKIVPKDGEIEITLNINIDVNGIATVDSNEATVVEKEDNSAFMIPDFGSGKKLKFGKNN